MRRVNLGIIGLGLRGVSYYRLIQSKPLLKEIFDVKWVADINKNKLKRFKEEFSFKGEILTDFREGMENVEAVIISTPDYTHASLYNEITEYSKHFIAEKPLATNIEDAKKILEKLKNYEKSVVVAYPLRYTPFYRKIKEIIESDTIGEIIFIRASEVLSYEHGANYARRWHRKRVNSGGLLVTKCCHDFDILHWLSKSLIESLSGFGGRRFFGKREGFPQYCHECDNLDCIYRYSICPIWYYLPYEEAYEPEKYGYDLCVFNSDMDIIDHAIVNLKHKNGIVSQFAIGPIAPNEFRRIHILGTKGELEGIFEKGIIIIRENKSNCETQIEIKEEPQGHYGGDYRLLLNFARCILYKEKPAATIEEGYYSLIVAAKAEESIEHGGILLKTGL